jgi:hypothetical protein
MTREDVDRHLERLINEAYIETVHLEELRSLLSNLLHWLFKLGTAGTILRYWAHSRLREVDALLRVREVEAETLYGAKTYRWGSHAEERRFAEAWAECTSKYQDARGHHHIDKLMAEDPNDLYVSPVSDEARVAAATAIQWLGSPVGQSFLYKLNYRKETPNGTDSP